MSDNTLLLLIIMLPVLAFCGEPDIQDGVTEFLMEVNKND